MDHFDPGVTDTMLQDYLSDKLRLDVRVERIQTKYDTYASFHIKCDCTDPSVFMDADLWPENAFVRWWREQRQHVQQLAGLPSKDGKENMIGPCLNKSCQVAAEQVISIHKP